MWLIETDFATAAEHLAFDEALVESADAWAGLGPAPVETLRLWEIKQPVVVLGRGSKPAEVFEDRCREDGVPILRRCSGGASIVAGPGCLMYSLLLSLEADAALRDLAMAHRFVMQRVLEAVREIEPRVELDGTCDLVIDGKKCSGNAVRYKRNWMLYHGTLLYDFRLEAVSWYLAMPPRQPSYRAGRAHAEFLTNILDGGSPRSDTSLPLRSALAKHWSASAPDSHPFRSAIDDCQSRLLKAKYS